MKILIDTNILIDFLRNSDPILEKYQNDRLIISGVVCSELLYGCKNKREEDIICRLYETYAEHSIDSFSWHKVGILLKNLKNKGLTVGFQDVLLTHQCLEYGLKILTNDRHFVLIEKALKQKFVIQRGDDE
jgi:predicted nucleic acid-binding protein